MPPNSNPVPDLAVLAYANLVRSFGLPMRNPLESVVARWPDGVCQNIALGVVRNVFARMTEMFHISLAR